MHVLSYILPNHANRKSQKSCICICIHNIIMWCVPVRCNKIARLHNVHMILETHQYLQDGRLRPRLGHTKMISNLDIKTPCCFLLIRVKCKIKTKTGKEWGALVCTKNTQVACSQVSPLQYDIFDGGKSKSRSE